MLLPCVDNSNEWQDDIGDELEDVQTEGNCQLAVADAGDVVCGSAAGVVGR